MSAPASLRKYFKPPFRYDRDGSCVFDAAGNMILDVRGYGYLTGRGSGALGLPDAEACAIQDEIGRHLADLLNAEPGK